MESQRNLIIKNATKIPKFGTPGKLIVFGNKAEAIQTGNNYNDIIIAVAQYEKGRVLVFSHSGYLNRFADIVKQFENKTEISSDNLIFANFLNWLTFENKSRKLYHKTRTSKILTLNLDNCKVTHSLSTLLEYDILTSTCQWEESVPVEMVDSYVKEGGSFLCAATPWGYLQINPSKNIFQMPYTDVLLNAGICLMDGCSEINDDVMNIEPNIHPDCNLIRCLSCDIQNLDYLIEKVGILSQINHLPNKISSQFTLSLQCHWESCCKRVEEVFTSGQIITKTKKERNLVDLWLFLYDLQTNKVDIKAHAIDIFPGDIKTLPPLTESNVDFSSAREDFYFCGCYAPAGITIEIRVEVQDPHDLKEKWKVMIGAHNDVIDDMKLRRWPKITVKTDIIGKGIQTLTSPFGGNIYFISPNTTHKTHLKATISNILRSPRFDSTNSVYQANNWPIMRILPGLWADISGKYITITLPSSSIRNIDNLSFIINRYDEICSIYHDLKGTDINSYRKQWIVTDEQPSHGYMHAGYPIVTHLDIADPNKTKSFLLNEVSFNNGEFWGLFHELGHNMQQSEYTFEGTIEVTVNIFTLYAMYKLCGIEPCQHPWLIKHTDSAVKYLQNAAKFEEWKRNPGLALFIYAQLIVNFKWLTLKQVFRRYLTLKQDEKPKNNQDKIDLWFYIYSQEVNMNLHPMARFWGIPLSTGYETKMKELNFEDFLTDDNITQELPERVNFIRSLFPNLVQKTAIDN